MSVRDILRLGAPSLRVPAAEVQREELGTPELLQLVADLVDTMVAADGAGLAAPQIGDPRRVCIVELRDNPRYPNLPPIPRTVLVNPKLTVVGDGWVEMFEGCLSVPGLRGKVRRPRRVQVRAFDEHGTPLHLVAEGAAAAVVQHEVDHLDGVLFVDRCDPRTLSFLNEYEQYVPAGVRIVDNAAQGRCRLEPC